MKGFLLLSCLLFSFTSAKNDYPANYQDREEWNKFMAVVNRLTPKFDEDIAEVAEEEGPLDCRLGYVNEFPFECPALPSMEPATSVHELTAADISVIGALGDSLTAAFGMESCTLLNLAYEYRGRSWSVGGDEDINTILTVANIIKEYNPNLKGYSEGMGGPNSEAANFNVAVSGARAEHMPGQAWELVNRIRDDPEVDFENDWKLVTIFIGGNDLCQYCRNVNKYATEQYVDFVRQSLDIMHENLPRTFVNVLGILLIPELGYYSTVKCDFIHIIACGCAVFKQGDRTQEVWELTRAYQEQLNALIMSGRYDTKDDFTVVYQPFLEDTRMPFLDNGEADASFFAPDCFHFSSRGHAVGAKDIWNNMMYSITETFYSVGTDIHKEIAKMEKLQPVGQKDTSWDPQGSIHCPSEDFPYFYTNLNSPTDSGSLTYKASGMAMLLGLLVGVLLH